MNPGKTDIGIVLRRNELAQGRRLQKAPKFHKASRVVTKMGCDANGNPEQGKATIRYESKSKKRVRRRMQKLARRMSR